MSNCNVQCTWRYEMTIKSTSNCQHHHNVHRDIYYDFIVYEAKIKQSISQTTSNKVRLKSTYI